MLLLLTSSSTKSLPKERVLQEIKKKFLKMKVKSEIRSLRDLEFYFEKNKTEILLKGKSIESYNLIYFRSAAIFRNAAFVLANTAKRKGIFFVDKFRLNVNSRGKLVQMFLFSLNNILIPRTYYSPEYDEKKIRSAVSFLRMPIIVKAARLGGGKAVYLAKSIDQIKHILKKNPRMEIILQEFIPNDLEYRIMVLGGKAAVAEFKVRTQKKEFRNNAAVGAKEIFINIKDVPRSLKETCVRAAKIMDIQVAGVDAIEGKDGKHYLTEVNSAPGLSLDVEGSYELEELVKYLARCKKSSNSL